MENKQILNKSKSQFTIECNKCKSIWTEISIYKGELGGVIITCLHCENTWITTWVAK